MPSVFSYARKYGSLFIWRRPQMHVTLALVALFILLKAFGKFGQQYITTRIFYPDEGQSKSTSDMYLFVPIAIFYSATMPTLDILCFHFETSLLAHSFSHLYKRFLQYQYTDWDKHLKSDLYSAIIRRSKGIAQFFTAALVNTSDHLIYCVLGIGNVILLYGFAKHLVMTFGLVMSFPVITSLLSILRTRALRKTNEAHDSTERKLKDIFLNYELIYTYDAFDLEIKAYEGSFGSWKFWVTLYWQIDDALELVQKTFRVLVLCIIFMMTENAGIPINDVVYQMQTFESILKRMNMCMMSVKMAVEASENMCQSNLERLPRLPRVPVATKESFDHGIDVRNVSVTYGENVVFRDVNFRVSKGEKVAITGPNGAGKSTFVKVLLGLEKFDGKIVIDGVDRERIEGESLSKLMAYMPQDPGIFEGTVMENITAFDKSKVADAEMMIGEYGMKGEMETLGFNKVLVERGRTLSWAQRQKICFLRAAVRDAPVMIFDEMTSGMDEKYELWLLDLVMQKMSDKTVVMIIHNLDLLDRFDKVVFFNNRTASACKPYSELLSEDPEFRQYVGV